jgi:hypothetical protein
MLGTVRALLSVWAFGPAPRCSTGHESHFTKSLPRSRTLIHTYTVCNAMH